MQPAELVEASYSTDVEQSIRQPGFPIARGKVDYLKVFLVILLPALIILLQSEAGSALVFTVTMLSALSGGLPGIYL